MSLLGAAEVDEEDDDFQHGDVIDVHAREADARRRGVVEPVPTRRVELPKIVGLGPGQPEPDVIEQEDHLHGKVWHHDGQRHQVQLSLGPGSAGLVATVASAQQCLAGNCIDFPVAYPGEAYQECASAIPEQRIDKGDYLVLTSIVCRRHCKQRARQNERKQEDPVRVKDSLAANDAGDVVSHGYDKVVENKLQHRNGEEDEGLDDALSSLFFAGQPAGSEKGDLVGDVLHDSTNCGRVECLERNPQHKLDVAPSVRLGPEGHVVGGPEHGVDGVEEIEKGQSNNHAGTSQLTLLVKEFQGNPAAHGCGQIEEDSEKYVGHCAQRRAIVTVHVSNGALEVHGATVVAFLLMNEGF